MISYKLLDTRNKKITKEVKEKNYGKQTGFYCKGSREVGIH